MLVLGVLLIIAFLALLLYTQVMNNPSFAGLQNAIILLVIVIVGAAVIFTI